MVINLFIDCCLNHEKRITIATDWEVVEGRRGGLGGGVERGEKSKISTKKKRKKKE